MKKTTSVKNICICAMCIALCYAMPLAFHMVGLGSTFCPIHLPVLLCALLCGPVWGIVCGICGPLLSSVLTGMPPANALVTMIPELVTYGAVCGLMMKLVHTRSTIADLYISLITAMVAGRVVAGLVSALFYMGNAGAYSIALWISGYFVTPLPGILLQLATVPGLVFALEKTRVVPVRYPKIVS